MNTQNIKGVEDSVDDNDMAVDIKTKPGDNLGWLTNYQPASLNSMAKKNKLFNNVFNIYRVDKN